MKSFCKGYNNLSKIPNSVTNPSLYHLNSAEDLQKDSKIRIGTRKVSSVSVMLTSKETGSTREQALVS